MNVYILPFSSPGAYSGEEVTMDGEYVSPWDASLMSSERGDSRFTNILLISSFFTCSSPGGPGESGEEGNGMSSITLFQIRIANLLVQIIFPDCLQNSVEAYIAVIF